LTKPAWKIAAVYRWNRQIPRKNAGSLAFSFGLKGGICYRLHFPAIRDISADSFSRSVPGQVLHGFYCLLKPLFVNAIHNDVPACQAEASRHLVAQSPCAAGNQRCLQVRLPPPGW
jgi:hypothetical protein